MRRSLITLVFTLIGLLWGLNLGAQAHRLTQKFKSEYSSSTQSYTHYNTTLSYNLANPTDIDSIFYDHYYWQQGWTHFTYPCTNQTVAGSFGGTIQIHDYPGSNYEGSHWEIETDSSGRIVRHYEAGSTDTTVVIEMTRYYSSPDAAKPDSLVYRIQNSEYRFFYTYDDLGRISDALLHKYNWGSLEYIRTYHINFGGLLPMELLLDYGYYRQAYQDVSIIYCFLLDDRYQILSIDNLTTPQSYHGCTISSGWNNDLWITGISQSGWDFSSSWSVGFDNEGRLARNRSGSSYEGDGGSTVINYAWEPIPPPVANNDAYLSPAVLNSIVFPNPSRGAFRIELSSSLKDQAKLWVFNIRGQLLRTMQIPANKSSCTWDGKLESGAMAPSGLYLFRLESGTAITHAKAMLIRD